MLEFVKKTQEEILSVKYHDVKSTTSDCAMNESIESCKLPLLHYTLLEKTGIVEHCFTTRMGGVSEDIFSSLNLSFSRGDNSEAVMENYRRVASAFGKTVEDFICTDQTHTTNVLCVGKKEAGFGVTKTRPYSDVDGLITNEPGVILSTFYADCVPLYFVSHWCVLSRAS